MGNKRKPPKPYRWKEEAHFVIEGKHVEPFEAIAREIGEGVISEIREWEFKVKIFEGVIATLTLPVPPLIAYKRMVEERYAASASDSSDENS